MTDAVADWSEHDLGRRFALGPPRDELTALAAMLDKLLGRIESSVRHEQRLTAELSHELRTPLAAMRTDTDLALRRERSPEELRTALEAVRGHVERMQQVVDALMTAAEHDAGSGRADADALSAARIAVERARPDADRRGVRLRLDGGAESASVAADRELTVQILGPLLDNAVRYGKSTVEVEIAQQNGSVVFDVLDDGPGVDDSEVERIFEPGSRGSAGDGRRGAGLGLALARRLARAAGGEVRAQASHDGGHFSVVLPSS
jgi:two-component system OmpR family sensor kinase